MQEGRERRREGGLINGSAAIRSSLAPGREQRRDKVGGGGGGRVSAALHSLRPPSLSTCTSSRPRPFKEALFFRVCFEYLNIGHHQPAAPPPPKHLCKFAREEIQEEKGEFHRMAALHESYLSTAYFPKKYQPGLIFFFLL